MQKTILLLLVVAMSAFSQAQNNKMDSWKITWNKKIILQTSTSNESANIRKIKSGDLAKKYVLELLYQEDIKKQTEWTRSLIFFDEKDVELLRKDSTRKMSITAAQLKTLFAGKKKIKIYTIAIPADPARAATVRVRRIHLVTLELI